MATKKIWYERRGTNIKEDEIDAMIRAENDPEKRNVLLVLQCLTSNLASNSRLLEELETKMHSRLEDQDDILSQQQAQLSGYHDLIIQVKTGWRIFSVIVGSLQAFVLMVGVYGYNLIADLRDKVQIHAASLPVLQKQLAEADQKLYKLITLTHAYIEKDTGLQQQDVEFDLMLQRAEQALKHKEKQILDLSKTVKVIKNKKAVRNSR